MVTNMNPLRIIRPYEISLGVARKNLEQTVGLILRTKRAVWLFLKATKTSSLDFRPSEKVSLHFFAVTNSVTDGRIIESQVETFVATVKNLFSIREVNIKFLTDFLCTHLNQKIFGKDNERPTPLEMAVIEINRKEGDTSMAINIIDYSGNARYPEDDFAQIIFGCTDFDKQAKIRQALENELLPDFSNEQVEALVTEALADFPGDMLVWMVEFDRPTEFVS